ncbi:hypothetical protein [Rhizobium sp. MHM7A]|uniref:hypothetical protein n=1 Tax=Rhizobium sp. MHM7A TaxID=2583233 RepID=UPI0011074B66|nr:hypothetical protein [Rhizobium sp. MHM7A]TLX15951.1 hypothetical protein FFR93_01145 [Rhizobium sp. MHM7A]
MGFQSDIYLGFAGKQEIIAAVGEELYRKYLPDASGEREEEEHYVEDIVPRSVALDYLKTKYGWSVHPRETSAIGIAEVFKWDHEGEDVGEDVHLYGVKLTSRYFPAFLDFREESGGLYLKRFNKDLLDDIEWVRAYLVNDLGLQHYKNAEVLVLDQWY